MKKFIIITIVVVLAIALIIRLSDNQNYDKDNYSTSSIQNTQVDNKPQKDIHSNQTSRSKNYTQFYSEQEKRERLTSYEIPRLTTSRPDQVLFRTGYVVSYNSDTKNPNWVAWHLTKEHTAGPWKKDGIPYIVDTEIDGERQETEDWYGRDPEIDHGHMCPAGDNKWSEDAMVQSFLLSNICPQNRNLNRGGWEYLESRCRGWAKHFGDIYIVTGPIFILSNYDTLGDSDVGIPNAFFKVILCMNKKPKALGFIYPNEETNYKMKDYLTTVDEVERITGIDFFHNLPDEIEKEVESTSDLDRW